MPSTYSPLKIELLATGENSGTWGTITNTNLGTALEEAITGSADVAYSSAADVTLTLTNSNASQTARNLRLNIIESGAGIGYVGNLILGSGAQIEKLYLINNTTTGAKTVKNTTGTGISVPAGKAVFVFNDGTNIVDAVNYLSSLTLGSALPVTSGGTGATTAATALTNLGGTTVGINFFDLTNPSAITFPRINADNSVSALDAATFRTAIGAGTGSGTVTSVTGTSPVASSGGATPAISLASAYGDTLNPYASKTANYVLAAPNGTAGVPTFRAVVAADIPTLNQNTTGTASNVTGTVAIANGGTGATTRQNAMDALAGSTTSGQYLRGNGTDVVMSAIQAADVPTLNQNTTGTASNVTGTVAIANGGTGATTAATARSNLGAGTVSSITAGTGLSGGTITGSGTIAIDATVATLSDTQTLTNKTITPRVSSTTSITSPLAWNSDNFDEYIATAQAANFTISADAGTGLDGEKIIFRIASDATPRVVTFTGGVSKGFKPVGVTLTTSGSDFTYTLTASKTTYFGAIYNAASSRWEIVALSQEA